MLQTFNNAQPQNSVKLQSPTVSKSEDVEIESNSRNTPTDSERSLAQDISLPIQIRDFVLDSKMTLLSPKSVKTTQTPATETQSASTETESVTAWLETQTPATQGEIVADSSNGDSDLHEHCPTDPRNLEVKFLKVKNKALKVKIKQLEKNVSIYKLIS